jgi:SulP family sulfate permease
LSGRGYASALAREALPDLSWRGRVDVRRELVSGLLGAVLVIPQAITFAYLAGLAPEYGLYCAVFVGFLASVLGNSAMVGGPNTAVSILLGLTVLPFAGRGSPLFTEFVLLLSLTVGLIQLVIWLLRGAELFRYFSPAAISGIKMGVGVLIVTSALDGALGMSPLTTQFFYEKFYVAIAAWSDLVNPRAALVSGVTVVSGLLLRRVLPRAYIVAAIAIGGAVGALIEGWMGPVASQLELLGRIPFQILPLSLPRISAEDLLFLEEVWPNAVAIAVLGLAQSLVIARDLKAQVNPAVDLHKEVFAQGVSNTLGPFFSSFAGSGSFNRTSVAVEMGARTPLSGVIAAVAVVLIALSLGPVLTYLAMPAVASALALVGIGMIQLREARRLLGNGIDGTVFVITLLTIAFLGLQAGIVVAVLASVGFFVAGVSQVTFAITHHEGEERIAVRGNLFYASLDRLANHLRADPAAKTVLDLSKVPYCDTAALDLIAHVQQQRARRGGRLEVVPAP